MQDEKKTKTQLISELEKFRRRIKKLEKEAEKSKEIEKSAQLSRASEIPHLGSKEFPI